MLDNTIRLFGYVSHCKYLYCSQIFQVALTSSLNCILNMMDLQNSNPAPTVNFIHDFSLRTKPIPVLVANTDYCRHLVVVYWIDYCNFQNLREIIYKESLDLQ